MSRTLYYESADLYDVTIETRARNRTLNTGMMSGARQMLKYAETVLGWHDSAPFPGLHVPTAVGGRSREEFKLRWWGLAEQIEGRDDAGHGTLLALTPTGVSFVRGRLRVPRIAVVQSSVLMYDGRTFSTSEEFTGELTGCLIGINDKLPFDQRDL